MFIVLDEFSMKQIRLFFALIWSFDKWDVLTFGQHVRKQWSLPAVIMGRPGGSVKSERV